MYVLGLTGGTGSGKTTALEVLGEFGAKTIDCDALYHSLLRENKEMRAELENFFGDISTNGAVDTKKLGAIVYSSAEKLAALNEITHKYVRAAVKKVIDAERSGGTAVVAIDAIALIEAGLGELCDLIYGITAPQDIRVARLIMREGISEDYARLRISAQKPDEWYYINCDKVLINAGSKDEFRLICREEFARYFM